MRWANVARVLDAVRHPLTVIGAIVIAFAETSQARNGFILYGGSWTLRHFAFVFVLSLVLLSIVLTALLVLAETKAASAAQRDRVPEAIARRRVRRQEPAKPPVPATPAETPPTPTPTIVSSVAAKTGSDDEPSILV